MGPGTGRTLDAASEAAFIEFVTARGPQLMRAAMVRPDYEDMPEPEIAAARGVSRGHGQEHGVTSGGQAEVRRRAGRRGARPDVTDAASWRGALVRAVGISAK